MLSIIFSGGPPQQGPPSSVPGSMPGPPGGALGAPMRGPPPPRPLGGGMPPGGMSCQEIKFKGALSRQFCYILVKTAQIFYKEPVF